MTGTQYTGSLIGNAQAASTVTLSSVTAESVIVAGSTTGGLIGVSSGTVDCTTCTASSVTIRPTTSGGGGLFGTVATLTGTNLTAASVNNDTATSQAISGIAHTITNASVTTCSSTMNVNSAGAEKVFGIARTLQGGTMTGCTVNLTASAVVSQVGGMFYTVTGGVTISDSLVNMNASVAGQVNGVVLLVGSGGGNSHTFSRIAVKGTITSTGATATGFVGTLSGISTGLYLSNNYVSANVTVPDGLSVAVAGFLSSVSAGSFYFNRNYMSGAVAGNTADDNRGCIMALGGGSLSSNYNYYDSTVCTLGKGRQSGAMAGVTGQNTAAMQPASAFSNWSAANWVFASGQYPKLIWEP